MYADRKEWPLEGVEMRLSHNRIHAKDCADCETEKGMLDEMHVDLTLKGDLDPAQRERLMDIAHRCPVHKTLTNEIKIRVSLA